MKIRWRWAMLGLVTAACTTPDENHAALRPLVAAVTTDPGQLNTAITTNGGVHTVAGLLYNGLIALDDSVRPLPELAVRWEIENGGALYRFHLRQDVKWHDGKPFTSADVKFTFDSLLLRFHSRTRASLGANLLRIDTPDDSTVEFSFRRPYAPLLQQLDIEEAPIMPKHVFAGSDPLKNPANTAPVGTGPYRFVSYAPGSEIRYTRNDEYFKGAPAIKDIVMRIVPDAGTQVIALEAGEVDWLFGVPGPERKRIRGDPRFRIMQNPGYSGGSNCVNTLAFNLDRPMLRDVRFRKAIAHAIDRRMVLERVLFGEGRVAAAPIASGIAYARATNLEMPSFDTAKASHILDSLGWKRTGPEARVASGVRGVKDGTALLMNFTGMPGQSSYGDLLRAQLRAVGVDLRIQVLEPSVFSQTVFTARDFDTAIISYCNGTDPEIGVRRQYVTSSIGPVPFSNTAAYRNPVVDSLFDRASAELNPEIRGGFYREIQAIAVRDQPYIWLTESLNTRAYNVRCHGFNISPHFAATASCDR
ncbi:MAG: ABC transporter substrate-binding protein [Gemmatimonadaceae bacterium]